MSRRLAAATAAAAALVLAGCSNSPTDSANSTPTSGSAGSGSSSTGTGSAGGDATAWAEKVCSSIAKDIAALEATPDANPTNPVEAKASLGAYFTSLSDALGNMAASFKAAGNPPVDGADALVAQTSQQLESAKSTVDGAKTKLAAVDTSSPAAFQSGFLEVTTELQKLTGAQDPTKGLRANAEIDAAFKAAPSCESLNEASAVPTS